MSDRYQSLYRVHNNLFIEGSPVIIMAGALLKDTVTDKVLAQLKIRNLELKKLIACKVAIRAFEPSGAELEGIKEYSYLDVNVGRGQDFGTKVPVYLPDKKTRKIDVSVTEIVFEDNTVWKAEPCEWERVPDQELISNLFNDPEIQK